MRKRKHSLQGTEFELQVAAIYRDFDADVTHNKNIDGMQVDVYAVFKTPDGAAIREAIECKDTFRPLGVNDAVIACNRLEALRKSQSIEKGVIVARNGFTQDARTQCDRRGVECFSLADLNSRLVDFTSYLKELVSGSFSDPFQEVVAHNAFISLSGTTEAGKALPSILDYLHRWLSGPGQFIGLFGEYGSGKTTTSLFFATELARAYLRSGLSRIPIWIELRQFAANVSLRSFLTEFLIFRSDINVRSYALFEKLNREGRFLLVFDGFDEMVVGADRPLVNRLLQEILSLGVQKGKVLLTCRTGLFRAEEDFAPLRTDTTVTQLMHRHRTYALAFINGMTIEQQRQYVAAYMKESWPTFMRKLEHVHNLHSLAERPILLNMMISTIKSAQSVAFSNVAELYEIYTRLWLERDDWRCQLSSAERTTISQSLAYELTLSQEPHIHYSELERRLPQYFDGPIPGHLLHQYEQEVRLCTFLKNDFHGFYSFVHRSFQEYFCALHLLHSIRLGNMAPLAVSVSLETTVFLSEYVRNHQADWLPLIWDEFRRTENNDYPNRDSIRGTLLCVLSTCGQSLAGIDLHGLSLPHRSRLEHAILEASDCRSLSGEDIDFTDANLERARMDGTKLTRAILRRARMTNASCRKADFSGADFTGADLSEAQFEAAVLRNVVITPDDVIKNKRFRLLAGIEFEVAKLRNLHGVGPFIHKLRLVLKPRGIQRATRAKARATRAQAHKKGTNKPFMQSWKTIADWDRSKPVDSLKIALHLFVKEMKMRLVAATSQLQSELSEMEDDTDELKVERRTREMRQAARHLSQTSAYVEGIIAGIEQEIDGLAEIDWRHFTGSKTIVKEAVFYDAIGLTDEQSRWLIANGARVVRLASTTAST